MTLIRTLHAEMTAARKSRSPHAAALGTLYADAIKIGKDKANAAPTDEMVIQAARKTIKGMDETLSFIKSDDPRAVVLGEQKALVSKYIPKVMNEAETRTLVQGFIDGGARSMPEVMKSLKGYQSRIDMKIAATITKELLG